MTIRKAEEKDILRIIELLGQVLQIHADIRPDIFIPGTTKIYCKPIDRAIRKRRKTHICSSERGRCLCRICILPITGTAFFN